MAAPSGVLQELNSLLQTLQTLKAPGVNKAKVDIITSLCTDLQHTTVSLRLSYCAGAFA